MAADSSTRSISTTSKSVRFAEKQHEVFFTVTRSEIGWTEKQCLWYSRSEVEKIRSDLWESVQALRGKRTLVGADTVCGVDQEVDVCSRGIEHLIESEHAVRRREAAKVSLVRAILREQKFQRTTDRIEIPHHDGATDRMEMIAMMSFARSKKSVATARKLALEDAKIVEEDLWKERKQRSMQMKTSHQHEEATPLSGVPKTVEFGKSLEEMRQEIVSATPSAIEVNVEDLSEEADNMRMKRSDGKQRDARSQSMRQDETEGTKPKSWYEQKRSASAMLARRRRLLDTAKKTTVVPVEFNF